MGKGDKKTKRGKIILGSHGVTRPKRKATIGSKPAEVKPSKPIVVDEPIEEVKPKAKTRATKKPKAE